MIVRKRVIQYLNECLQGPPQELAPHEVNDMYQDSLKEQAEKLMIPGYAEDSSAVGRLANGKGSYI